MLVTGRNPDIDGVKAPDPRSSGALSRIARRFVARTATVGLLVAAALAVLPAGSALAALEISKWEAGSCKEVNCEDSGPTSRFYTQADDKTALDTRRVRLAALHVPVDSPPTPFFPGLPFHAKLTGYLKNPLKGDYSFKLVGPGPATLKINDKTLLTLPAEVSASKSNAASPATRKVIPPPEVSSFTESATGLANTALIDPPEVDPSTFAVAP